MADSTGTGLTFDPMGQFTVHPLWGSTIHFFTPTNVALWMLLAFLAMVALMVWGTSGRSIVPTRTQSISEVFYTLVRGLIEDISGHDGLVFFPYIMTLFCFILFSNLLGLIPGAFTTTSHFAVTVFLALGVFLTVTIVGLVKHGIGFLGLFWVDSAPLVLRPVLAVIEVISYFVRPASHSIRLAGNMMAGHAVIKVFAAFGAIAVIAPVSIIGIVAMYAFEVLVCVIQAYVFTLLTCVYLRDALHPHH